MSLKIVRYLLVSLFFFQLTGKNNILEIKAAYFLPTDAAFKDIYPKGGGLYGIELTMQLSKQLASDSNWRIFGSFDYFQKTGKSIGLGDSTKIKLIPLAVGLKYFIPCTDFIDFYAGLGFQPVNVRTENCSQFVVKNQSLWGFGGIAKMGTNFYIAQKFTIDIFINYSFVKVGSSECKDQNSSCLESIKANIGATIFGAGIGCNF